MSRSGYSDGEGDNWSLIRWRGAVRSALTGARGQAFLRELAAAMDAMPVKELVAGELEADGAFCALGVVGKARGVNLSTIDTENWRQLSEAFGIAESMAREVMYENDECVVDGTWVTTEICGPVRPDYPDWGLHTRSRFLPASNTGALRWHHMRKWVEEQIQTKGN